jgi:glycerate kinase
MKILIAPDKFKGSLTAEEVCLSIEDGLRETIPGVEIIKVPLADGGEGTGELLTHFFGGEIRKVQVTGPLFERIPAEYGTNKDGTMAFIEMAKASGLQLLSKEKQNPLYTTTYGTGELIADAINKGATKIILGIGGSATNDAGLGMAEALGYGFFNSAGEKLKPIGENLIHLHSISTQNVHLKLTAVEFIALCDVTNPLYGTSGAAFIYGPQKGADSKIVKALDDGLRHFEKVIDHAFHQSANFPGAGAGGGIASGAHVFLNAKIQKAMDYMIQATQLEEKVRSSDMVITGEGKIDTQTLSGKVVSAVAQLAGKFKKPVVAFCGRCELRKGELEKIGVHHVISLTDPFTSTEEAIKNASSFILKRIRENHDFFQKQE